MSLTTRLIVPDTWCLKKREIPTILEFNVVARFHETIPMVMDENFRHFGRNIGEISDIDDNRSEISHGNSFEGKIAEKSEISPIFRYRTEISVNGTHAHVGDFLLQNIEDIYEISVKYRIYIGNIGKNIEDISRYIGDISK